MTYFARRCLSQHTSLGRPNHPLSVAAVAILLAVACGTEPSDAGTGGSGGSATGPRTGGQSGSTATGGAPPQGGTGGGTQPGNSGGTDGSPGSGGSGGTDGSPGSGGSGGSGGAPGRDAGTSNRDSGPRADGARGDTPAASASAPGCNGVTAKFCADFDDQTSGQEPKGPFTLVKNNSGTQAGAMLVDGTKAFSGKNSFHIHITNASGDTKAQLAFTAPLLPLPSNDINGRAMVFLTRDPPNHWDLVTAFGTNEPEDNDELTQYTLGSMSGHLMPVYQPGDDSVDSSDGLPIGRWACLQWRFFGAPAAPANTHNITVKLDGKLIDKGEITRGGPGRANWAATIWKSMKFGFITFGGAGNVDMWIDDLAFGERENPLPDDVTHYDYCSVPCVAQGVPNQGDMRPVTLTSPALIRR